MSQNNTGGGEGGGYPILFRIDEQAVNRNIFGVPQAISGGLLRQFDARCPICDLEVFKEHLPLHIEVNHPVPRDRWWLRMLRWLVATQAIACGGAPFSLSDNFDAQAPITTEDSTDATPQEKDAAPAIGFANVRDVPDVQTERIDSAGVPVLANRPGDAAGIDASAEATTIADAGTEEAKNESSGMEASVEAALVDASGEACPPPVVGGYSDIGAKNPAAGRSIISSFPGECGCDYSCSCLMKSSVCLSLGNPISCEWMPPGGLYIAVVTCG
jgi:hypothetical protein